MAADARDLRRLALIIKGLLPRPLACAAGVALVRVACIRRGRRCGARAARSQIPAHLAFPQNGPTRRQRRATSFEKCCAISGPMAGDFSQLPNSRENIERIIAIDGHQNDPGGMRCIAASSNSSPVIGPLVASRVRAPALTVTRAAHSKRGIVSPPWLSRVRRDP